MTSRSIRVAKITKPQGLTGLVRIELTLEDDGAFFPGQQVELASGTARRPGEIEWFRRQSGRPVLKLRGVDDRSAAEAIVGSELWIASDLLPEPAEGSYYTFDLKGCDVFTTASLRLGTVVDVWDSGGSGLLRIDYEGRELLVPFAREFLKRVDIAARRIEVELPEGLLELNRPG
ncbi:MAG TPA: ribosome maturation factor RimM [Terriglobia bacterium]|nr:ribosome maturation factor RimM [Terriglobia bacterium]